MTTDSVTLFSADGVQIGKKPRKEIDKKVDIFRVVYVRIYIGKKIILTKIRQKAGGISKTNENKWGLPVATIVRDGETQEQAFERASLDDLGVVPRVLHIYEGKMITFKTTSPRIVFGYDVVLDTLPAILESDCLLVEEKDLEHMYQDEMLAETAMIFSKI